MSSDLVQLLPGPTNDGALTDAAVGLIRDRFLHDDTFTRLGPSHALVAVNPHKRAPAAFDNDVLYAYGDEYRSRTAPVDRLQPHIFQIAADAYFAMRRTGRDTCLFFRSAPSLSLDMPHTSEC